MATSREEKGKVYQICHIIADLKTKPIKRMVKSTPRLPNFTKLRGLLHFLPKPSNIFTQIYLPYLWHFATLAEIIKLGNHSSEGWRPKEIKSSWFGTRKAVERVGRLKWDQIMSRVRVRDRDWADGWFYSWKKISLSGWGLWLHCIQKQ